MKPMARQVRRREVILTAEELIQSRPLLRRTQADFWLFVTSCVQTLDEHETDPELSVSKPFPRFPYLNECAHDLVTHRRVLFLKSRQMLISWLLCAYAVWRTLFHNGNRVLFLSIRESDAFKMKHRVDHILANLPDIISYQLDQRIVDNESEITFEGGSSMMFLPSSDNPGRSLTATDVILDEHAFHRHDLAMYAAIKPTLSGGGNCFSVSTPNGVGNLFHALKVGAAKGSGADDWNGYHLREVWWHEHPDRDEAWFQETTRDMPARLIAQEYLLDFLQSGQPVFDANDLKLTAQPMTPEEARREVVLARKAGLPFAFWIGVDVGEGLMDGDLSVTQVVCARTGRLAATLAGRWKVDVFAKKVKQLHRVFPGLVGVERIGAGAAVILELERHDPQGSGPSLSDWLYRHREWDERGRKKTRPGWVTSGKSKPVMIDELEVAVRKRDIKLSSQATIDEMLVFQFLDGAGHSGAPAGYHDDRVMALAIAWQMRKGSVGDSTTAEAA